MNTSFYGGRRGASFVLAGRFATIEEMIANFSQGSAYTVINYDEYVVIDTVDKNDPDNGKLYRRGYNYQDELGGAEYIGQIVGPSGLAPRIEMSTIEEVEQLHQEDGYEYRFSRGEYNITNSLVPGKEAPDVYNDSIRWVCCSVRDGNNQDTTAYIGFSFPYTVIEYTASSVDPYYKRNDKDNPHAGFTNTNLIERQDHGLHPFYEQWHVSIPKGLKGNSFKNIRVIDADDQDNIVKYDGQAEDRRGKTEATIGDSKRKIVVYDYYEYDAKPEGEKVSLYLGDYDTITDVSTDNDGTIHVSYSHREDTVIPQRIKWIDQVAVNTGPTEGDGNQQIHVTYNDGSAIDIGEPLNYIMRVEVEPISYHLLVLYSDPLRRKKIVREGKSAVYDGRNDWHDLGCVKEYNGILVGTNYPLEYFSDTTLTGIIKQLNYEYPKGFERMDINRHGKIISVGPFDQNKMFFGFDYSTTEKGDFKGWFYLGTFAEHPSLVVGEENDLNVEMIKECLPAGSAWFIVE